MITSTASWTAWLIRHPPTGTLRKPRSTNVPRLSGSPASARSGNAVEQRGQRLGELHPGQRGAEAEVHADAERQVVVGIAVDVGTRPARRRPPGRGWRRRAAPRSSAPPRRRRRPTCTSSVAVRSNSCSAESKRSISSTVAATSAPGRRPRRSIATRPLPKTLTDASWPALSSSTTAATTSSSVSSVATRSVIRSSAGLDAALGDQLADQAGEVGGGARPPSSTVCWRRRDLVHPHDRLRPVAQVVRVRARHAEQVGDHEHRQRLGVRLDHVEAVRVDLGEQLRRELAHPRPQPLDVAAGEGRGHRTPQPGVLGRLVLHHLVAVQQVERLEVVERLLVLPDPAQPPVALHRADRRVRERQVHARRLVPGDRRAARAPRRSAGRGRRRRRGRSGQARSSGPNASGSTSSIALHARDGQQQQVRAAVLPQQLPAPPARHEHLAVAVDAHDGVSRPPPVRCSCGDHAALGAQRRRRTPRSRRCSPTTTRPSSTRPAAPDREPRSTARRRGSIAGRGRRPPSRRRSRPRSAVAASTTRHCPCGRSARRPRAFAVVARRRRGRAA